jgi:DNA-binding NtrC family response regulator
MPGPMFVLLLTADQKLRNLIEQLFIIDGVKTLTATTVEEIETLIVRVGLAQLVLVIIDTAAFGADEFQQQQRSCRVLRTWTVKYLGLPYLVIGSVLQRASMLSEHTEIVQFLVKPFRLNELVSAVRRLWLERKTLTGMDKRARC